ncbi:MAG TPA: SH3 domain-containing protein [Trichormus sp.]
MRNSVAAKSCGTCGFKFRRKPIPLSIKIGLGVSAVGFAAWGVAAAVIMPSFTDAGHSLTRIAKHVAAGPKSPDDAIKMRKDLDSAIISYLKNIGKQPANQIANLLTSELASSAYEVHAFDLPRGLKIVEVDTLLQACDYLVINDNSSTKVQALPGMEVVEGGRIVTESGAPTLVLIGHSSGQGAKRPLIKVLALLPGDVADETGKALPDISGEGTAAFAANNKDIGLTLSLWSVGTGEKLFSSAPNVVARTDDEQVKFKLVWDNGHYKVVRDLGSSPLSTVYAVASTMRNPSNADAVKSYLGDAGVQFAQANALDKMHGDPKFSVRQLASEPAARPSRRHRHASVASGKVAYYIAGDTGVYEVDMKSDGVRWAFDGGRKLSDEQAKIALQVVNPTDIKATQAPTPGAGNGAVATALPTSATAANNGPSAIPTTTVPAGTTTATTTTGTTSNTTAFVPKPPAKIIVKQAPTSKLDTEVSSKPDLTSKTDMAMATGSSKTAAVDVAAPAPSTSSSRIADAMIQKYASQSRNHRSKSSKLNQNTDAAGSPVASSPVTASTPPAVPDTTSKSSKSKSAVVAEDKHTSDKFKTTVARKTQEPEPIKATKSHDAAPAETATSETSDFKPELMQIDASKIKVRKGPATDYKSVAELDKGAKVMVVGKKDGWYKVKVNGREGYVYGGLVNNQKSDAYTTATVKHTQTIADSRKKHVAKEGDRLVVLGGVHDGKYKVQLANGKVGYVPKDSIDVKVDAPNLVP